MKIGIIREGKVPIDRRVALTPEQASSLQNNTAGVEVFVQKSEIRCYSDQDYSEQGLPVVDDVSHCDILLGVKEVPIPDLIAGKTYLFFSHTIKEQEYNRDLLREILAKKIRLIDYETLTDESSNRVIAFGRWAGIVGAYNGLWTFGQRYNLFKIRRAFECFDLEDLKTEFPKLKLPAVKILITGGGRVAKGAMEVLHGAGIRKVTPAVFLNERFSEPVFTQLNSRDYHHKANGEPFNRHEFFDHPERYVSDFAQYTKVTDLLIACAFWDPKAPVLFTSEEALASDFKMRIIADITCDIEGSIPSTKKPSTIEDPIYDFNPSEGKVEKALTDEANLTVMAVDNLPCELPRDASKSFGDQLLNNVLPSLLGQDETGVIKRATITEDGRLTAKYSYLENYVKG